MESSAKAHFRQESVSKNTDTEKFTPSFKFSWDTSTKPVKATFVRKKSKLVNNNSNFSLKRDSKNGEEISLDSEDQGKDSAPLQKQKFKDKKDKDTFKVDDDLHINVTTDNENVSYKSKTEGYHKEQNIKKQIYKHTKSEKSVSEKVFAESGQKFSDLLIHKHLVSNLEKINFKDLTNVQEKAIPVIMSGKDVLIRSQTGSGKTLAYAVPIVDALHGITPKLRRQDGVQVLIVVPTRELALQTHELFGKINTFQWVVTGHLCGGEKRKTEKDRLRKGVNVLIGTPGRLLDHLIHTSALKVNNIRCLVIDEADRLLEMGFRKDIVKLVEELDRARKNDYNPLEMLKKQHKYFEEEDEEAIKEKHEEFPLRNIRSNRRQTILLSATLTKAVTELVEFTLKDHVYVDALDDETKNTISSDSFIIPDTVSQLFVITPIKQRLFTLAALIVNKSKQNSKTFVFMASSQMVDYHYELFTKYLLYLPINRGKMKSDKVVVFNESDVDDASEDEEEEAVLDIEFFKLHGSMDQKTRKEVFTSFRAANKGVLLCTDVAARGLDVPTADCIVQYNGPQSDDDYVHRVGRTGRVGLSGEAIIFLTPEESEYINRLREHKVFLKKRHSDYFLRSLCNLMEEPEPEVAGYALQRRFESAVSKDRELYKQACFAYSSWSRFYNSYPSKMRTIFNFKNVNMGHYAASFAIKDPPSHIAKVVRGQVSHLESPALNPKLAIHTNEESDKAMSNVKRKDKPNKKRSRNLVTSEFESGLEPMKKKKKKSSVEETT